MRCRWIEFTLFRQRNIVCIWSLKRDSLFAFFCSCHPFFGCIHLRIDLRQYRYLTSIPLFLFLPFTPHSFGHNIDSLAWHEMNSSFFFKFFVLVVCATDKNEKTSLSDYEAIFRLFSFCPLLLCRVSCLYFAVEKLQMARHVFLANSHKFEREKKIFVNCTFVYPQFVASLVFLDANWFWNSLR